MSSDVAARIAQRSLTDREAAYAEEVRRLLTAGLEVMSRDDGSATARVADIVAAAGLSNDAFYRHFSTKSALIDAILEDGAVQVCAALERRMAGGTDPHVRLRRWVDGILAQAHPTVARRTRAVLVHASGASGHTALGRQHVAGPLAELVAPTLAELGSTDPALHALLASHATLGVLSDHIWAQTSPGPRDRSRMVDFWTAAVSR